MYKPNYGQSYDRIVYSEQSGIRKMTNVYTRQKDEPLTPEVAMGNCFPLGSLTDHDLAIVEDCIRGLHDRT